MSLKRDVAIAPEKEISKNYRKLLLKTGLVTGFMVAGLSVATQYFAHQFQYQEVLGSHLSHFYAPWSILNWASKWWGQLATDIQEALRVGMLVPAFGFLGLLGWQSKQRSSKKDHEFLHGSASWSLLDDIKRTGLLGNQGIYIGAFKDKDGKIYYLRHEGPEHALLFAPTRSGKGVGFIIPTLLSWENSALILDLKGELWALTAGWRKHFAENCVMKLEFAALMGSVCWNPLWEIRVGTAHEVGDTQNVASLLVDPDGKGLENHWQKTAYALFTGLILHALYKQGKNASFASIDAMLSPPKRGINELWKEMIEFKHLDGGWDVVLMSEEIEKAPELAKENELYLKKDGSYISNFKKKLHKGSIRKDCQEAGIDFNGLEVKILNAEFKNKILNITAKRGHTLEGKINHPVVGAAARDMLDRPDEEAGSVLSTVKSYLSLFRDPIIAKNTSRSDFYIKDLMNYHNPVSLYLVTQPNDKTRLKPLVRMFVSQSTRLLADKMEFENGRSKVHYKHRLLMLLDEFASLGKLEIMQESLAFLAGYGIKCYLVCQDTNQLKSRETGYGPDETITSNCHIQIALPPNRLETADYLSRLIGDTTVLEEQVSINQNGWLGLARSITKAKNKVKRRLITEEEVLRMQGPIKDDKGNIIKGGNILVHVAGMKGSIYGIQPLYFKDPIFQARANIPAPKQSDILRKEEDAIKL